MSDPVPTVRVMHHPWRLFRELAHITLRWAHLDDGTLGITDYEHNTVTLTKGMNQAQRRCTIEHERLHVVRGPVPDFYWPREEVEVDKAAARNLIGIRALGEALAWAHDLDEAAEELWVDVPTLRVRLEHLHPAERHYLKRRLADVSDPSDSVDTC